MKVKVQYFAVTRELANVREEVLDLDGGTKVFDFLKLLVSRHIKLRDYVFNPETGAPRPFLQFMVNDDLISNLNGYDTILPDGCTFAFIPPVGGG